MKTLTLFLLSSLLAAPAASAAATDAPEYLLGDLGVRVDLPSGWKMLRWSDWDFKAETSDSGVMLFAWGTPYQVPVDDPGAWAPVYEAKIQELGGEAPKLVASELEKVGGRPVAALDLGFAFGGGGAEGVLYGGTITVAGQNFHLAVVTAKVHARRAEEARDALLQRLDVREEGEPLETVAGATVSAGGIETKLPDGWREPTKPEVAGVTKRAAVLGLPDLTDCWIAMRPRPVAEPDVMVTCPAGMALGVVDELSFAGVEPRIREAVFGKAPVPAGQQLPLSDRLGVLFDPKLESQGLAVAVVPYDQGITRTWVLGEPGDASLAEVARAAAQASTWSGPHPVTLGDQVSYYLTYQPTHPVVLGSGLVGLLLVGGVVGGAGFALKRSRKRPLDDLDDLDE